MEGKHQSLLFVKSATALNSLLIFSIFCTILYHHQRVTELEDKFKICHDMQIFSKDGTQLPSLLPRQENQPQHLQRTAREVTKDDPSKVWSERYQRKHSVQKPVGKPVSGDQESSVKVNTTNTTYCSHCLKECFELGSPKVKQQNISGHTLTAGKCFIVQGEPGPPGQTGQTGMPGIPGKHGRRGSRGRPGKPGKRGRRGSRGKTGKPGPVGPAGSPGKQGPKGSIGPQGERAGLGLTGLPGPMGDKGEKGDTSVVGIKGNKGDAGVQGPGGVQGVKGEKGLDGAKGDPGGQKGDSGTTGQPGSKGETGPRGCSGTLIKQPSLRIGEKQITVNEGDTAHLICNASANPVSSITWKKNNATLKGQRFAVDQKIIDRRGSGQNLTCPSDIPHPITKGELTIHRLQGSDSGMYTCRATNMMGVIEYKIQVTVQLRVRMSVFPSDTTVVQRESVALSCDATGVPKPVITWKRKDGGQLPGKRSLVSGALRMYEVKKKDEGVYVCTASNVLGFKQAEALLTVNVQPSFSVTAQSQIKIVEGQKLTLQCSASGTPVPKITWSKLEGTLPSNRSRYDNKQLIIERITFDDRGTYKCQATNIVGSVTTHTIVTVLVPPKILARPNPLEFGYRGRNKTLICKSFGFPAPTVTWSGPSSALKKATYTAKGLSLKNVQFEDSRQYTCRVSNKLGSVEVQTILVIQNVVFPVLTIKPPVMVAYRENQSVSIACAATGNPSPVVAWSWTRRGNLSFVAERSSKATLLISSLKVVYQGNYTCTATNELGDSTSTTVFVDIDECSSRTYTCHKEANCVNTASSYSCNCGRGFGGNGKICFSARGLEVSSILGSKPKYIRQLLSWLDPVIRNSRNSQWHICWHGNTHGFAASTFHSRCDNKGPTVTIVRVGSYIFGGYTDQSWKSGSSYYTSYKSFIFTLYNTHGYRPQKLTVYQYNQYAIYGYSSYGPTFGGGHDLNIKSNANINTDSYTNMGHTYYAPYGCSNGGSGCSVFAGSYSSFTLSDIEVFYETT